MAAKAELLREGKTKRIWRYPLSTYEVTVESKDDITAGDGVKREQFEGKGAYSTETAVNCFELLRAHRIPNHFVKREGERTFRAVELHMIPIEVVMRRLATGSYLKRNPTVEEGTRFVQPAIEFFDKDDGMHDPLLVYDFVTGRILRYDAKLPLGEGFLDEVPMRSSRQEYWIILTELIDLGERTFLVLEKAWAALGVTLVDLKIECGRNVVTNGIVVGDVITNDEWRIWPNGEKSRQLDKQNFREAKKDMDAIKADYATVAEMTRKFTLLA